MVSQSGAMANSQVRGPLGNAPDGMEISIFDLKDIPFYNRDVEAAGDPAPVLALKGAIQNADGVILATPEYNYGISGALKNAVDWASSDRGKSTLMGKSASHHI
jgi:chromate reductase